MARGRGTGDRGYLAGQVAVVVGDDLSAEEVDLDTGLP